MLLEHSLVRGSWVVLCLAMSGVFFVVKCVLNDELISATALDISFGFIPLRRESDLQIFTITPAPLCPVAAVPCGERAAGGGRKHQPCAAAMSQPLAHLVPVAVVLYQCDCPSASAFTQKARI